MAGGALSVNCQPTRLSRFSDTARTMLRDLRIPTDKQNFIKYFLFSEHMC